MVEAMLPAFLHDAANEIRYVMDKDAESNVSRAEIHPIRLTAQRAVANLPTQTAPAFPPAYVLELMRKQPLALAVAQAFGNLNNQLLLEGYSPEQISKSYHQLSAEKADIYHEELGDERHFRKLELNKERLGVFLTSNYDNCSN